MFAPDSVPARCFCPLLQARKQREAAFEVLLDGGLVLVRYAPISRFSRTVEVGEDAASLGRHRDAARTSLCAAEPVDVAAVE